MLRLKDSMPRGARLAASFVTGVLLAGAVGMGYHGAAQAQAQGKPAVSKAVAKPLKAAQEAMEARRYPEALARLREVQAIQGKSAYDQYLLDEMLGYIAVRTKDYAEAARALEAGLNSPYFDRSEAAQRINALAQVNYALKNYDKSIEYGNRAVKAGSADDELYTLVAQAYYLKGDNRGTKRFVESYVDELMKRGTSPKEQYLQLIMSACTKLNDTGCVTETLERLVAYYPKTEYWQNLLYSLFQAKDQTDKSMLHLYRLASEVDVLKRPEDYTEMAQLAIEQGSPGEAARILEKGFQKKIFPDARSQDKNKRLLASAKQRAAADLAGLSKVDRDAAADGTGAKDVSVGLAYLSYQQYEKAVTALSRGLTKPGVKNEPEARLLLGIAQLEAGKKDEAMKTFRSVKGDPRFERLANLWNLHARQA
jgi:tetratricopeptide (TPR) repeat protein